MSQTSLLRKLGAPLANARWSWGSVRAADNTVFLRVWQDRARKQGDACLMQLTHADPKLNNPDDLGHQERLKHIEMIRQGAICYLIMCRAADTKVMPRVVKSCNETEVFPGGKIVELDGEIWIEQLQRVPVEQAMLPQSAPAASS